jgi:membrane-associated protease RseP (regulator of RpoE activity)
MYLYRTRIGIKLINYFGDKYKKTLTVLSFLAIISGYILMVSMIFFLWRLIYVYLFVPDIVKQIKIPPLMPLIPYLPEAFKIDFLPPFYFTYWIIAIAIIAVFHEFSHGIFARRFGVKIKTTGFGFLGPFLAAFVEPDEKNMSRKPKYQQIAILSAGTFANLILAGIFFLILAVFFISTYQPAGVMFNTYTPMVLNVSTISIINNYSLSLPDNNQILNLIRLNKLKPDLIISNGKGDLKLIKIVSDNKTFYTTVESLNQQLNKKETYSLIGVYQDLPAIKSGLKGTIIYIDNNPILKYSDLQLVLKDYSPGENILVKTKYNNSILEYNLTLAEDINTKGKAIIGIGFINTKTQGIIGRINNFFNFYKKQATFYEPKFNKEFIIFLYNLIWWIAIINLSVALINMWPVAIFDGGRMFMLTIWAITKSEKFAQIAFKFVTYLILISLGLLMIGWFRALF